MFRAGSNFREKSPEEIFYQDFKTFYAEKREFGVGQLSAMSEEELQAVSVKLKPYLAQVQKERKLDMIYVMLTNIVKEKTELLCFGERAKEVARSAFQLPEDMEDIKLKGLVSRKKQLIPSIVTVLQQ